MNRVYCDRCGKYIVEPCSIGGVSTHYNGEYLHFDLCEECSNHLIKYIKKEMED